MRNISGTWWNVRFQLKAPGIIPKQMAQLETFYPISELINSKPYFEL